MNIFFRLLFAAMCIFLLPIFSCSERYLVYGTTGWIGAKLVSLLQKRGHIVIPARSRLENLPAIEEEITAVEPDIVISAAGLTGRPNVDWCEDHRHETIATNLVGALNLAGVCEKHGLPMVNFGTGCIYQYDAAHPLGSGIGFTESDTPNFDGSYYSKTKIMLDTLLRDFDHVLNLRLRMPISDDLHPRSFVTKIIHYSKVVDIPNSMTILTDLLPISVLMAERRLHGTYNFVNPGTISHNCILALYKKYIDPSFTWQNFSLVEQASLLKAGRSNNELDTKKLLNQFPDIVPIQESIVHVFERMATSLQKV